MAFSRSSNAEDRGVVDLHSREKFAQMQADRCFQRREGVAFLGRKLNISRQHGRDLHDCEQLFIIPRTLQNHRKVQ
jgi:hypothetical protein